MVCAVMTLPLYFLVYDSHRPAIRIVCALLVLGLAYLIVAAVQSWLPLPEDALSAAIFIFGFIAVFYYALCARKYRRLVPYITIVMTIAPLCVFVILVLLAGVACTGWQAHENKYFMLILSIFAICAWLFFIWLGLLVVSTAYTRRKISEQQLSVCCWIILTGLLMAFTLQVEDEDSVQLVGYAIGIPPAMLLALFVYLMLSRSTPLFDEPQSLLYLRVFRSSAQSLKLFRRMSRPWRSIGPVNMIAGTDLAKVAVEPDEIF